MSIDCSKSLQDQFAPNLICFGCGPANDQGLQLKSFVTDRKTDSGASIIVATFTPAKHHLAFEGIVNGGIVGTLLDCHMNWAAAWHLMQRQGMESPPCCVTAKYEVAFQSPTPEGVALQVEAWVTDASDRKAVVAGTVGPQRFEGASSSSFSKLPRQEGGTMGEITATGTGTFVAVKPGHPAYHRW